MTTKALSQTSLEIGYDREMYCESNMEAVRSISGNIRRTDAEREVISKKLQTILAGRP